jgi:hypothetical protein
MERVLLEKLIVSQLMKKLPSLIQPEGGLQYSKEHIIIIIIISSSLFFSQVFPGTFPLEPEVNSTTQASSF